MSKASRRFYRTLALGLVALAALVWAAIDQFGIAREDMFELLFGTLMIAVGIIALAALGVGFWVGIRKLFRRGDDG
jgi:hypothetical protein